jgi:hypothetical protein
MIVSPLVVIDKIHVVSVASLETKHDAPVAGHRDRPKTLESTLETVKPKAGKGHVSHVDRLIEPSENALDLAHVCRQDAAVIVFLV